MVNDQMEKSNKIFDESQSLSELISEALELRSLDVKKLAELTDIPVHYLAALTAGDLKKLPAVPYVRGYLMRIAEALRMDANLLLGAYRQEILSQSLKTSGPEDKLPVNRFTLKRSSWKRNFLVVGIILVLAVVYLIWRVDDFLGTPQIEVASPSVDNLIVNSPSIKLAGEISPQDKLTINGEETLAEKSGRFEKDLPLQAGINTIEFKVKRFLGKEVKITRQVIYQP